MMITDFHGLPDDELKAELERMIANHHAPMRSYASRQFPTVTRSSTGVPSPADIAARGELIEVKS
jgi:hypothetical protein